MHQENLGCLVIHGFGGGIYEIKSLADYLKDKGFIVSCPKLKGHTGVFKDMKGADYKDWISSAEEELVLLMEKTKEVVIVGFSMGGLIAVNLACKYSIKAIVTINTPIYYWNLNRVALNIFDDFKNKEFTNIKRYIKAKNASPTIAMINFLRLLYSTKPKLADIDCDFLIIQTKDDDTTKLNSVYYLYDHISSLNKEIILHDKGGHLVLKSAYKEDVIKDVESFLDEIVE